MPQATPQPVPPTAPETTRKMLATLWERNLPVLHERLEKLEHAVSAARMGTLTSHLRAEAQDIAHKLSGSLGMFGYHEATGSAREIEQHLEAEAEPDAVHLEQHLCALRAALLL